MNVLSIIAIRPNLELKTQFKQLLGYLLSKFTFLGSLGFQGAKVSTTLITNACIFTADTAVVYAYINAPLKNKNVQKP